MAYVSVDAENKAIKIDVDTPEPLPSFTKVIRAFDFPVEMTLRLAGLLFTVYSISEGITVELIELLQDLLGFLLYYLNGYSIKLVKYVRANGKAGASMTATPTIIPPAE